MIAPEWYCSDFDNLSLDQKAKKFEEFQQFGFKLRRLHWYITENVEDIYSLFHKKRIIERKCFMCPVLLSFKDVTATYSIPYSSIPKQYKKVLHCFVYVRNVYF